MLAIRLPIIDQTRGHATHSLPAVWKSHLAESLMELPPTADPQVGLPPAPDIDLGKALGHRQQAIDVIRVIE